MPDPPPSVPDALIVAGIAVPARAVPVRGTTVGAVVVGFDRSTTTVAEVSAAAGPSLPDASATPPALSPIATVPEPQPVTLIVHVVPDPAGAPMTQPAAVPERVTSAAVKPVTAVLNVTVQLSAVALVGLAGAVRVAVGPATVSDVQSAPSLACPAGSVARAHSSWVPAPRAPIAATRTGWRRLAVVPSPTSPKTLTPQHRAVPSSSSAQVSPPPISRAATALKPDTATG